MQRVLLVSNRLPITAEKKRQKISYTQSSGGLATGLDSFYREHDCRWIGWPGISKDRLTDQEQTTITQHLAEKQCIPVYLSGKDIDHFYHGFANKTIWPLFHYFPQYTSYESVSWTTYQNVNKQFRDIVLKICKPGDSIWIHDYQLLLLPQLIRDYMPDIRIGFFLHIPFPSLELFRLLPWRKELLYGMLGADLIGFHTYDYIRHFLNSVRRLLGLEHTFNRITFQSRIIQADVFPMGIDYNKFASVTHNHEIQKEAESIRKNIGNKLLILSVDRLDYTKGIIQRLEAYDWFLEKNPSFKEKVTMVLVEVPSRSSVDSYKLLKIKTDEIIGRINGKHGTLAWAPVLNLYRALPFNTLTALYEVADVAVITPLRDGMNLVAKEYVAVKQNTDGVLILGELTGAAREMGEALIVNPNSIEEIGNAIKTALTMGHSEKKSRIQKLQQRLRRYDINKWAQDFLTKLVHINDIYEKLKLNDFSENVKNDLIESFRVSKKRLLLFDYDGTLVPFANKPEKALPDEELMTILKTLITCTDNGVAIISGRDKQFLDLHFGTLNSTLFAEHGIWIKQPGSTWRTIENLRNDWKNELRPILDLYTDRTPGSILEEKEYAFAWHYRNADPELASLRVKELKDALIQLLTNRNISVMDGNKVLEVRNSGINKGTAASIMLAQNNWDFILCAGDDVTDEDLFSVMPQHAFSLKVGIQPSHARFNIKSCHLLRILLKELCDRNGVAERKTTVIDSRA